MKDRISNPGYNWQKAQEQRDAARNRMKRTEDPNVVAAEKEYKKLRKDMAQQYRDKRREAQPYQVADYGSGGVKKYYGQPMPISKEVLDGYFQAALDTQMQKYADAIKDQLQQELFAPSPLMKRLSQEYPSKEVLDSVLDPDFPYTCMWCAAEFATVEELEPHEEGCC